MAIDKKRCKNSNKSRVVKLALLSRGFVLALVLLWRLLGKPYDTSALLNPPCLSALQEPTRASSAPASGIGGWLGRTLESSIVWDGVYYIRIAECGYEYEQTFAFFPVLPLIIRFTGNTVLSPLIHFIGYRATLALSGYVVSNVAFILSAIYFHRVSCLILQDKEMAFQSTAFFCLNPASIFYTSIYSESLFSLLTFAGLWAFLCDSPWKAATLFAISGGVRSNGVLHGGFLLYQAMHKAIKALQHLQLKILVRVIFMAILQTAVVFTPFVAFQAFGFSKLCYETDTKGIKNSRPWCNERIPYMYGFVQSNYWNVGFLRYFELKQLPNFLLASPMLSLAIWSFSTYVKHNPRLLLSLGTMAECKKENSIHVCFQDESVPTDDSPLRQRGWSKSQKVRSKDERTTLCDMATNGGFFSPSNIPFLFEMAFMTFVACFVMHVQVATRFLSICCPIYWFAAHKIHSHPKNRKLGYVVWAAFISYVSLGSLLFVNFYPFT